MTRERGGLLIYRVIDLAKPGIGHLIHSQLIEARIVKRFEPGAEIRCLQYTELRKIGLCNPLAWKRQAASNIRYGRLAKERKESQAVK